MNIHDLKRKRPDRNGVALIAVLGFLSVLVVMAVALLISMRTERLASEVALDDVACRILLEGVLSRAMSEVDMDYGHGTNMAIRRPKAGAIAVSDDGMNTNSIGSAFQLLGGKALDWIPKMYLNSSDPDYNGTNKAASARWILVRDDLNPDLNHQTNIIGRFAYISFDCTGMMDANLFTNPVQRGVGISVSEISIAYLPDVMGYLYNKDESEKRSSEENFFKNKANYSRFGTFPEILFLNDGVPNASGYPEAQALSLTNVNNLMPYSLCYDAGWWDWSATNWNWKAGDYGAPNNIGDWTNNPANAYNAFLGVGFTAAQASNMAVCYQDYVDTDSLPGGTTNPVANPSILCCETIPMINEVIFTNELTSDGVNVTLNTWIDVEVWYPFLGYTNLDHYTALVSGQFIGNTLLIPPDPDLSTGQSGNDYQFTGNNHFGILRCGPFTAQAAITNIYTGDDLLVYVDNLIVLLQSGGQNVDRSVLPRPTPALGGSFPGDPPPPGSLHHMSAGYSALDPRLNQGGVGYDQWWSKKEISPGTINFGWGNMGLSANGDLEGTVMYVRNGPMQSVAELGFIPTGSPWTTIDLFSPQGRELLAKFRTTNITAGTKIYTNGLINPNTLFTNVLIAAFRDAPIEAYPGDPSSSLRVDSDMAGDIAAGMYEISSNAALSGSNVFDSPAGWVTTRAFARKGSDKAILSDRYSLDNNQKESIIRNSYRLFNPNQQLFTIVVIAQAINDQGRIGFWDGENIDTISGEKRAVALVWRDPFPDPPPGGSGRHEMFVRTFKYLDE